jgi:hypothetical protein
MRGTYRSGGVTRPLERILRARHYSPGMRVRLALGAVVVAIAAAGAVVLLTRSSGADRPKLLPVKGLSPAACFAGAGNPQEVQFKADNGTTIEGAVLGSGSVGVVLAHQVDGNMCQWIDFAHFLAAKGYRALPFTFPIDANVTDGESVVAAAKALRALGAKKIVLMGASRGGTAVLDASGKFAADAVIALSPPAVFGYSDGLKGVETSTAPLLIAVGQLDTDFLGDDINLDRHAKAHSKQLIVKKASGEHGVQLLEFNHHSLVDDAVQKFLARVRAS